MANWLGIDGNNAPWMYPYGQVFNGTANGFTVYYYNGATGFSSPTWDGYPAVYLGTAEPNPTITSVSPNPVPGMDEQQAFTIYGSNGTLQLYLLRTRLIPAPALRNAPSSIFDFFRRRRGQPRVSFGQGGIDFMVLY